MEIFDLITPREQETIKHYIQLYADVAESAPLPQVLHVWNKQKRTLFRLLGKQLKVKIPVEIPRNTLYYKRELQTLYNTYSMWDKNDAAHFRSHSEEMKEYIHNDFIFEYLMFITSQDYYIEDVYVLSKLIFHQNIETGYISTIDSITRDVYKFESFKYTVKNNMRTVRTIQKILKLIGFPYMDLFEEWRNKVSDLNINRDIKANLVFSIHPLDFMSMSDNNCDWSSCMSWCNDGGYSAGIIEMMNSNMAIIAYLESNTPFNIIFNEEEFSVPNKSWRCLFYINKYIIASGKSYPYLNNDLIKLCLKELSIMAEKNLKWTYQYKEQLYKDMKGLNNNFFVKYESIKTVASPRKRKERHSIYLYTNGMYNDLIEYQDSYLCYRNYISASKKFCVSGPLTCMCCGDYIINPSDIMSYDDIGCVKVCADCETHFKCDCCHQIKYNNIKYSFRKRYNATNFCSEECLNNMLYFPEMNMFISKDERQSFFDLVIIGDKKSLIDYLEFKYVLRINEKQKLIQEAKEIANKLELLSYLIPKSLRYSLSLYYKADIYSFNPIIYINRNNVKTNKESCEEFLEKRSKWIPAKEVLNENCCTFSN